MTAMTAATIDQLSGGRMILGIGSSGPQVAEGWHGQRFANQLQRTREYVAVVRMALARERVEFHGETLELPLPDGPGKALKLTICPVQERIPIYLAAIGPKNTALAGEIADGWIPTLFSPEHVSELRPLLEEGAARVGRIARGLRHRADRQRVRHRRPRGGARRDAPVHRPVRRRDGLAQAELLQPARRRYGFEAEAAEIQDLYLEGKREEAMAAIPDALIDTVSLCGPPDVVRERLAVYRDAGVGTLGVTPIAFTAEERLSSCAWSPSSPPSADARDTAITRLSAMLLGAFGDPGHAFPMIALGRALAARGHEVTVQTWKRWREHVEAEGLTFAPAPEYHVFPIRAREPLDFYEAVVHATARHAAAGARAAPGRRRRRHPHARPRARRARSRASRARRSSPTSTRRASRASRSTRSAPACRAPRLGRAFWRRARRPLERGLRARPRGSSTTTRARLGLPPLATSTAASAASWRSSPRSPSSSTRARGRAHATSSAR